MMDDQERRLLLDLVAAALATLESSLNLARFTKALSSVLIRKGVVTAEEIERVARGYDLTVSLSEAPDLIRGTEQWNSLARRLEDARLRLLGGS